VQHLARKKGLQIEELEQAIIHNVEFQKNIKKGTSEIYRDLEPMGLSV
jgi:hypothetical protein